MPLTAKGNEILTALKRQYGSTEKAKEVLYAGKNKGTFKGIDGILDHARALAGDMEPAEWRALTHGLMKFFGEEAKEPEHQEDAVPDFWVVVGSGPKEREEIGRRGGPFKTRPEAEAARKRLGMGHVVNMTENKKGGDAWSKPVDDCTAADLNRRNRDFYQHAVSAPGAVRSRDADPDKIEKRYRELKAASKEYLAKRVMGKIDHRSAMSAPKGDLIAQILNDEFSRKDLDAWGK